MSKLQSWIVYQWFWRRLTCPTHGFRMNLVMFWMWHHHVRALWRQSDGAWHNDLILTTTSNVNYWAEVASHVWQSDNTQKFECPITGKLRPRAAQSFVIQYHLQYLISYHTISYIWLCRIISEQLHIYMFCNHNCLGTHLFFSFSDIILLDQSCFILLYDLLGHVVSLSKLHLRDWHLRKCMVYEEKTKKEDTVYHRNTIFHWYKWFSREHLGQNSNHFGPCSRLVDRNGKCKK